MGVLSSYADFLLSAFSNKEAGDRESSAPFYEPSLLIYPIAIHYRSGQLFWRSAHRKGGGIQLEKGSSDRNRGSGSWDTGIF